MSDSARKPYLGSAIAALEAAHNRIEKEVEKSDSLGFDNETVGMMEYLMHKIAGVHFDLQHLDKQKGE